MKGRSLRDADRGGARLEAGRELDARVSEQVMRVAVASGVRCMYECGSEYGDMGIAGTAMTRMDPPCYDPIPDYSTRMDDAWKVVEAMREHPDVIRRTLRLVAYSYSRTYAAFDSQPEDEDYSEGNGEHATPLAICRAALKATADLPIRKAPAPTREASLQSRDEGNL